MSLVPKNTNIDEKISYHTTQHLKKETMWEILQKIDLSRAVELFLKTLSGGTSKTYGFAFKKFFEERLLDPKMTLGNFAIMNLESKLDQIKEGIEGKEATKQVRAAAFVSFTGFLQRKTEGLTKKAVPNKEKGRKTFQKIREKTAGDVLSLEEVEKFLKALKRGSLRNYLIGALQLQGAKRISEVLEARIEAIDWEADTIHFIQKKSDVLEKRTQAFFPGHLMRSLKEYLGQRDAGLIFITRSGRGLSRFDVRQFYQSAYKRAGINKKGLTHMLRATTITELSRKGFHPEEIMTLSGHSSMQMVSYYDRSSEERNPSRRFSMV